jgi:flagellar biosynthesis/type III secretory pathway protein FliH
MKTDQQIIDLVVEALDTKARAEGYREGYACGNEDGACWSASLNATIEALKAENAALKADAELLVHAHRSRADAWEAGYHYANKFNTSKP